MAKITSDQWGIMLGGGDNMPPQIIRASQRKDFPADATWIAGDQLAQELQANSALHSVRPQIERMVQDFEQRTHSGFSAPRLSDTEAQAVVDATIGDILKHNTLAARLIRFALADPDLHVYIIGDAAGVQAYLKPNNNTELAGFCDDKTNEHAVYIRVKPSLYPFTTQTLPANPFIVCEELLHHAMKRLYNNHCEVHPVDNLSRHVMLDKAINADRLLARQRYPSISPQDDDSLTVDQKLSRESEPLRDRFRKDFEFPEWTYSQWNELYYEFPVKMLVRQAMGVLNDPAHTPDRISKDETMASRYPNLMQYVTTVIEEDLDHFEKTGKLPEHILDRHLKTLSPTPNAVSIRA